MLYNRYRLLYHNDDTTNLPELTASAIGDYYNESAMKAKKRNALPDDEFGLPRLRAYPLNDRAHVKQAIRMFGHCKDPEDQKILAGNIFKAMKKHGVDMKIGKKNPLYKYAPAKLQESTDMSSLIQLAVGKPLGERSREDIVKEHLRMNGPFYNNLYYGPDYAKSAKAIRDFRFLDFFYPDMTRMNFPTRLECVCGGLAAACNQEQVYDLIKIRRPLETDFTKPLGWCTLLTMYESLDIVIPTIYSDEANWFKVDISECRDHLYFCLRLYSIMGKILLDPNFDPNVDLTEKHMAVLTDWQQRVWYHYDLLQEAETEGDWIREVQYLFDLFWTYTDNPYNSGTADMNVIGMLRNMACVDNAATSMNETNDAGELITRDRCTAYLVNDLGLEDTLYLLPDSLEYPIVNKESVRLAMDMIHSVPKDRRQMFADNLNRKYKELGCTFSISVDHPYAPYADKNIVDHMTRVLLEGIY